MIPARIRKSDPPLYEVVRGARVDKPLQVVESIIVGHLATALHKHVEQGDFGAVRAHALFTIPNSGNDRKPDVAFVSFARWPADRPILRVNAWPVAPDLAVEVVSPTDKAFDVIEKVHEYFAGGVRQVWHVYSHTQQVFVFDSPTSVRVLTRGDELTAEPVVPGFRMAAADLFPLTEPRA